MCMFKSTSITVQNYNVLKYVLVKIAEVRSYIMTFLNLRNSYFVCRCLQDFLLVWIQFLSGCPGYSG